MHYVNLGSAGVKVSRVALGCLTFGSKKWRPWVLEEDEAVPLIKRALDNGINFFDTADFYSLGASEEVLGRALRRLGVPRQRVVISSKVGLPVGDDVNARGLSRKHIRHAIDDSLVRLGVEYLDLYQIHRFDAATPMDETIAALDEVVRSGRALYLGASSMHAWRFARLLARCDAARTARFATMQSHYNLVYREEEREMIPLCVAEGVGVLPWSPLARGFLAGSRGTVRGETDDIARRFYTHESDSAVLARVGDIARRRGVSNAQVALAWLARQPGVVAPLIGATKPHHIDDACAALELNLDDAEMKRLGDAYQPHPVIGHHA
ncbi:MAG: aldo/keto reductase [Hyphomicrobiales bacterium]|nr:aldo/keto reductase [Hyphomicrobiales bacterium]MBV8823610.1 aldo/keto reductase [Hyphomicrobiales bacterium]MBV9429768.1 aldo/keto reductase [Bradyrhizobiaceae bacterium]